uniref:Uncharacterized protein n=1 Tax=Anguilla anguilla TaxID=7936 RepID=A0A0E9QCM5_ANGAN
MRTVRDLCSSQTPPRFSVPYVSPS